MSDYHSLVIKTSWKPNRKDFLAALGIVPGGLGGELLGEVYEALFVRSVEARSEFNKYYSVEYADFASYLEIRYGESLDDEEVDVERVYIVESLPQVLNGDYEDSKLDAVLACIEKLDEAQNENQN